MYTRTLLSGEYELGCPLPRGQVCKVHVNKDEVTSSSHCSPPDIQLISLSDSYPGLKTEWTEILKLVTSFLSVGLQELRRFCGGMVLWELPNQQTISVLHARLVVPAAMNYQGSITFSVVH